MQYLRHDIRVTEVPEVIIPEPLYDFFSQNVGGASNLRAVNARARL